jgi:hypothetical protein
MDEDAGGACGWGIVYDTQGRSLLALDGKEKEKKNIYIYNDWWTGQPGGEEEMLFQFQPCPSLWRKTISDSESLLTRLAPYSPAIPRSCRKN